VFTKHKVVQAKLCLYTSLMYMAQNRHNAHDLGTRWRWLATCIPQE